MNDRILVKVSSSGNYIAFRTITPRRKSSQTLYAHREKFEELERRGDVLCHDTWSFAFFFRSESKKTLSIRFTWLSSDGGDQLRGWEQTVSLPYDGLMAFVRDSAMENGPSEWAVLSMESKALPKLVFCGKRNLHAALANKTVRRKLVRFLRDNFQWEGTDEVRFYNDFLPYSFSFQEFRDGQPKMNGGLILSRQENLDRANYSIHT